MTRRGRAAVWYALNVLTVVGAAFRPPYSDGLVPLKTDEIFRLPIEWFPAPQWANYPTALGRFPFGIYFFNSAVVALAVMACNVFFGSLAGYGLAKFRFPLREVCFRAILSTLMLPLEILLVPTFLVVRQLGLLDSYGGLILPLAVDAFGFSSCQYFLARFPPGGGPAGWLQRVRDLLANRSSQQPAGPGRPGRALVP